MVGFGNERGDVRLKENTESPLIHAGPDPILKDFIWGQMWPTVKRRTFLHRENRISVRHQQESKRIVFLFCFLHTEFN